MMYSNLGLSFRWTLPLKVGRYVLGLYCPRTSFPAPITVHTPQTHIFEGLLHLKAKVIGLCKDR